MPDGGPCRWRASNGDDVKAYLLSDTVCFHVVVDGLLQTQSFAEVNGFLWFAEDECQSRSMMT